jgi:hypothetical protein
MARTIDIVFADWLDALRRGDLEHLERSLAPDVVHQGIRPELVCRGRDAVLRQLGRRAAVLPRVQALELVDAGDRAVLSLRGPDIGLPLEEDGPPSGGTSIVFTVRGCVIARMEDFRERTEALAAAGLDPEIW